MIKPFVYDLIILLIVGFSSGSQKNFVLQMFWYLTKYGDRLGVLKLIYVGNVADLYRVGNEDDQLLVAYVFRRISILVAEPGAIPDAIFGCPVMAILVIPMLVGRSAAPLLDHCMEISEVTPDDRYGAELPHPSGANRIIVPCRR